MAGAEAEVGAGDKATEGAGAGAEAALRPGHGGGGICSGVGAMWDMAGGSKALGAEGWGTAEHHHSLRRVCNIPSRELELYDCCICPLV